MYTHTAIPSALLDRWMTELSGDELKVAMYVARKSFGAPRTAAALPLPVTSGAAIEPLPDLADGTGLPEASAAVAVEKLTEKGVLLCSHPAQPTIPDSPAMYCINLLTEEQKQVVPPLFWFHVNREELDALTAAIAENEKRSAEAV